MIYHNKLIIFIFPREIANNSHAIFQGGVDLFVLIFNINYVF